MTPVTASGGAPQRPAAGLLGWATLLLVAAVASSTLSATELAPRPPGAAGAPTRRWVVTVEQPLAPRGTPCSDGSGASCGTVAVPRDYADPGQGTVAVGWRLYRDAAAAGRPVIRGAGLGVGASVGASVVDIVVDVAAARPGVGDAPAARHDLLAVDQRGWGSSEAVGCPFDHEPALMVLTCSRQQGEWTDASGSTTTAKDLERVLAALQSGDPASGQATLVPAAALPALPPSGAGSWVGTGALPVVADLGPDPLSAQLLEAAG